MRMTIDLTGQKFGELTVLERTKERQDGYCVWRCRCSCGKEILVNTKRLQRGTMRDCGCVSVQTARKGPIAEDLTGRRFGRLTVLHRVENRNGRVCWACRCDCGTMHVVTAHDLKEGRVKSCGCLFRKTGRGMIDLKGQRYGRLTVVEMTERRDKRGSVIWRCRCDCGGEICVSENGLVHGNYRSCGCLKKEIQKDIYQQLHFIDGTCLEMLEKRKHRKDNTSGFRGVSRMKNGRYRVYIGFKGKRYYIGYFSDYQDAVTARLQAEQYIHDGFVKDYALWQQRAGKEPEWAKENPFVFEVKKLSGRLEIISSVRKQEYSEKALSESSL